MTALVRRFRKLSKAERDAVRAVLVARERWAATYDSEHFADYWAAWRRVQSEARVTVIRVVDRAIDEDLKATDLA